MEDGRLRVLSVPSRPAIDVKVMPIGAFAITMKGK
jgi:hypothetical protein